MLIFLKRHIFLHFKTAIFFLFHFAILKECDTLESNYVHFFQLAVCDQPKLFCVTENDIGQRPPNHTPPLYELLVSVVWLKLINLWWSVKDMQKNALKIEVICSTVNIRTSDNSQIICFCYECFFILVSFLRKPL